MQEKKGSEKREVLLISFSISARFVFAIIVAWGLDFYRWNLVPIRNDKVYLIVFIPLSVWDGVRKQVLSCRSQYLCYHIFIDISQIGAKLIVQQLVVDIVFSNVVILECKCDKQAGVRGVHLKIIFIFCQCQPGIRIICWQKSLQNSWFYSSKTRKNSRFCALETLNFSWKLCMCLIFIIFV